MTERKEHVPVIVLQENTLLPGALMQYEIKGKHFTTALNEALKGDQHVFLVGTQNPHGSEEEISSAEAFYQVGTYACVKQVTKMRNGKLRGTVQGEERATWSNFDQSGPYWTVDIEIHRLTEEEMPPKTWQKGMVRYLKSLMENLASMYGPQFSQVIRPQLRKIHDLIPLLDQCMLILPLREKGVRQQVLSELNLQQRCDTVSRILNEEESFLQIRNEYAHKVQDSMEDTQREFFYREQLRVLQEELGDSGPLGEAEGYLRLIEEMEASEEVKDRLRKEVGHFRMLSFNTSESAVIRSYIETLLELPWDKATVDSNDLAKAKKILDRDHYGLTEVKERVLEYLAVRQQAPSGKAPILCLVGPPGTGKTSIGRSIADALGKRYVRLSLGGIRDEAEIRGHRRTYVASMPGRIVDGIRQAGVKNPLMVLDEIDKLGNDYRGDPASAMLEVLDGEQNKAFVDHYVELPVDLSEVLFIATANTTETIPKPLLDRMEVIELNTYTANEKLHIAKNHLVKKQLTLHGLTRRQLSIADAALVEMISHYTRESGVRQLERLIGTICRKCVYQIKTSDVKKINVNCKNLQEFLGKEKYPEEPMNREPMVGIVKGLAWTNTGGEMLEVEALSMPGKGRLLLTGNLGDVMKESASIALSCVRSVLNPAIPEDYFEHHLIHVHVPEGATPKDGPSAGITMATALYSTLTQKPVRQDLAMTGEITLQGRVLPIGGLKEKLLAANLAKMKEVCVPLMNKADVEELSPEIVGDMSVTYVKQFSEVVSKAVL